MHLHPSTPPAELDGARIERYALLDGIAHLARVTAFIDGVPAQRPAAVLAAESGFPGVAERWVMQHAA